MRSLGRLTVVAIAFGLIAVSTAEAASSLYTAAQIRGGRLFSCNVVNTGTRDAIVALQAVNSTGGVDAESVALLVGPGEMAALLVQAADGSIFLYCKFIVTAGAKTALRASYCVHDANGICQASGDAR